MDRDRRPPPEFEDQYRLGRGQSYRPGGAPERSPLRSDSYRARSPPRHASYGGDSYRGPRPRSRSPPRRNDFRRRTPTPPRYRDGPGRDIRGGDSYRGRPRSPPPRREELPRDDLFRREPARDFRDERPNIRPDRGPRDERNLRDERNYPPRSPLPRFRDRSPLPLKRTRDPSPISSRGRRTPPPPKRERVASPPRPRYDDHPNSRGVSPARRRPYSPNGRNIGRDYPPHNRSPLPRPDRPDPRAVDDWRRPRSPPRNANSEYTHDGRDSGRSGTTSRRSSPRPHPARPIATTYADERPTRPLPPRDDVRRPRSPDPRRREDAPPLRERPREEPEIRERPREELPPRERPRAEPPIEERPARESIKTEESNSIRPLPSGPSVDRTSTTNNTAPSGRSSPLPTSTPSAASRTATAPPSAPRTSAPPPTGPRSHNLHAADSGGRGGRGGYGSYRGGRGGALGTSINRGESFQREAEHSPVTPTGPRSAGPPNAPRASIPSGPANHGIAGPHARSQRFGPNGQPIPDGPSSAAPPTGPRLHRRPTEPALEARSHGPHPAIADLPKVIDGGQKADPIVDLTRLIKLEDEAEKLRRAMDERDAKKRKSMYEWDRLARECEIAALKSELAEQSLRKLDGEAEGQAAF